MPQFNLNYGYIPVSSRFIEEYMPKANAAFVKIYFYALNLASKGKKVEYSEIAADLGLLESDVVHAFEYWETEGVLKADSDAILFSSLEGSGYVGPEETLKGSKEMPEAKRPGYAPGEAASAIYDNSTLSDMVMLAQEILGKTLNTSDTETLYWFYDGLKFSPEVILMLLEYCVSKDKRRMSYIEKVAISWHERRITSMEAVNEYIQKEAEKSGAVFAVRKILGINNRAMSSSEEQYINRWLEMYKMSDEMIAKAYDQCIMQTAKLSLQYMEKILERWYKQGIHTVEEAERDEREFRENQLKSAPAVGRIDRDYEVYSDDYNHEELEELTRKRNRI